MYLSQMQGMLISTNGLGQSYTGFAMVEADGAIPVGAPVITDTGTTTGQLVVVGAAASRHRFRGVYTGRGGTGAAATVSGTSGYAAVDGDLIEIQWSGAVTALVDGDSVDVVDGDPLEVGAGVFVKMVTASAGVNEGYRISVCALEGNTGTTAAKKVFIHV